jgi:hypothetical protein
MTIHTVKPIAFLLSLAGLLGLLVINVSPLFGKPAPFEVSFFQIFLLMFPLWAFTIFYLNNTRPLAADDAKEMGFLQKIRYFLGDAPEWALAALAGIYLYALYCVFLFVTGGIADPEYVNGQYQVNNHGFITVFTEAEYRVQHNLHLRSITGFFMAFFAVSTVALAPWPKREGRAMQS